ncbi:MAG: hypothetical protein WAX14_03230 [Rhodococcus sp. (in: high G+C Gram-positive bacteria)]|uniref:hypothetical protein n=1 Tax=Rhodococcus sp. TaxID=1831 RepID=UPI003BB7F1BE
MIDRHTGTAPTGTEFLDTLIENMTPGGAWAATAGTVDAVEIVIEAARRTVLDPARRLVAAEIDDPRPESWTGQWPDSEGFYLATIVVRFEQLLEACEAVTALHRSGRHRAGWAVLGQAADTLTRLWMLTDTLVCSQPRDEARRSSHAWYAFADAYNLIGLGPRLTVHPFDAALSDDVGEDEDRSLDDGRQGASSRARELVTAIEHGVRLAQVHIPGALLLDPAAATDPGGVGAGLAAGPLIRAQLQLTAALVHTAAISIDTAFTVSIDHR